MDNDHFKAKKQKNLVFSFQDRKTSVRSSIAKNISNSPFKLMDKKIPHELKEINQKQQNPLSTRYNAFRKSEQVRKSYVSNCKWF